MHPAEHFRRVWQGRGAEALISVHRGLWGPAPENSREALRLGAPLGIVEVDVQIAADGVPVVMHDPTLDRMTGDLRKVAEVASGEISGLSLRAGDGGDAAALSEERVPTLDAFLAEMPEGAFLDLDCKYPEEVEAVAAHLATTGQQSVGSLKIDVEDAADIDRLVGLQDRFGVMIMAKVALVHGRGALIPSLIDAGAVATEVWFDDFNVLREVADLAGDRMALSTYTLDPVHCCGLSDAKALEDPDAVWGRLLEAGITVLMTDRGVELAAYLTRAGQRSG